MFQGAEEERRVAWLEKMVKYLLSTRSNGVLSLCEVLSNPPDGNGLVSHAVRVLGTNKIIRAYSSANAHQIIESEDIDIYKVPFMSLSEVENTLADFSKPNSSDFVLNSRYGHPNIIKPRQLATLLRVDGINFIGQPFNTTKPTIVSYTLIDDANSPSLEAEIVLKLFYDDGVEYQTHFRYNSILYNANVGNYPTGDTFINRFVEHISEIKSGSGMMNVNSLFTQLIYFPVATGQPWFSAEAIYSGPTFTKLLTCPYSI